MRLDGGGHAESGVLRTSHAKKMGKANNAEEVPKSTCVIVKGPDSG
jgi:hypothetical protein